MISGDSHYVSLAAAYCRGRLGLTGSDDESAVAAGVVAGLRLHRFKRTAELPRVRRVIGALLGLAPAELLDLGSGRGVFLWPLVDAMPELRVLAVDRLAHRVAGLAAVARGGVSRLAAARMDATRLAVRSRSFDVVTVLEVLEHIPDAAAAVGEAMRVAGRAVIATVPSHEDDNPEHIHLFDGARLEALFLAAGARRVSVEHVRGHIVAVALR
ncbi:MAG TPA: methyltransferase domain-containing protein [Kofleriaceae bacterium]|nr:methyltransferase domain-containing protein [Kofleriaceae bacterium]